MFAHVGVEYFHLGMPKHVAQFKVLIPVEYENTSSNAFDFVLTGKSDFDDAVVTKQKPNEAVYTSPVMKYDGVDIQVQLKCEGFAQVQI